MFPIEAESLPRHLTCPRYAKVTIDFIRSNPKFKFNWDKLSENMRIRDIVTNPDLPWNTTIVSERKDLDIYHIIAYPSFDWNMFRVSKNINIIDIIANPSIKWNYFAIGFNPSVTIDHIINNPDFNWNWWGLSKSLPHHIIMDYHHFPWKKLNN